jgi:starch phosphorylase
VETLWRIRCQLRLELVKYARKIKDWDELLDPNRLTVVFARRGASYKQLAALLQDKARLRKLLLECNIQFVIAGKAHPKDKAGKAVIRELCKFIDNPANADVRRYIVYLENYNAEMARVLVAGADVWLNTPEWGMEASGTSGMKAILNGALTLSVKDGWCADDDMIDHGVNGWLLGGDGKMKLEDLASELYTLLEYGLVPLFFNRHDGIPYHWVEMILQSITTIAWKVSNLRMFQDYARLYYGPMKQMAEQRSRMAA